MPSVVQPWVNDLTMMQQSVLFTAVRGPDGLPKYHPSKYLLRWYRRCLLLSAMDGRTLHDPVEPNGGSFTGPSVEGYPSHNDAHHYRAIASIRTGREDAASNEWRDTWEEAMDDWVDAYLQSLDEIPHHFQLHFMHGAEILGYKHPGLMKARPWWHKTYLRLVWDMHLRPESEEDLDDRLGDSRERWLAYADRATQA